MKKDVIFAKAVGLVVLAAWMGFGLRLWDESQFPEPIAGIGHWAIIVMVSVVFLLLFGTAMSMRRSSGR